MTERIVLAGKTFGVIIETARLRLRPLREDDLADMVKLIDNWEVACWLSAVPHPYTEADGRKWIALVHQDHATSRPLRFAVALKETDRLIGGVGLDGNTGDESEELAVGYWLGQPYWGNGYAYEAARTAIDDGFGRLGLGEIVAFTVPANQASRRVMEKLGMTHDPTEDFDFEHPRLPRGHPLRCHVLYRLRRPALGP